MAILDKVQKELEKKAAPDGAREAQLKAFRELKEKLDKAGYKYGDRYESPLMHRLGWNSKRN